MASSGRGVVEGRAFTYVGKEGQRGHREPVLSRRCRPCGETAVSTPCGYCDAERRLFAHGSAASLHHYRPFRPSTPRASTAVFVPILHLRETQVMWSQTTTHIYFNTSKNIATRLDLQCQRTRYGIQNIHTPGNQTNYKREIYSKKEKESK